MSPDELERLRAQVRRDAEELPKAVRIRADLPVELRARVDAALARERLLAEASPMDWPLDTSTTEIR